VRISYLPLPVLPSAAIRSLLRPVSTPCLVLV
jgi:hypothetical protein